jgi:hypothetical protein
VTAAAVVAALVVAAVTPVSKQTKSESIYVSNFDEYFKVMEICLTMVSNKRV